MSLCGRLAATRLNCGCCEIGPDFGMPDLNNAIGQGPTRLSRSRVRSNRRSRCLNRAWAMFQRHVKDPSNNSFGALRAVKWPTDPIQARLRPRRLHHLLSSPLVLLGTCSHFTSLIKGIV